MQQTLYGARRLGPTHDRVSLDSPAGGDCQRKGCWRTSELGSRAARAVPARPCGPSCSWEGAGSGLAGRSCQPASGPALRCGGNYGVELGAASEGLPGVAETHYRLGQRRCPARPAQAAEVHAARGPSLADTVASRRRGRGGEQRGRGPDRRAEARRRARRPRSLAGPVRRDSADP